MIKLKAKKKIQECIFVDENGKTRYEVKSKTFHSQFDFMVSDAVGNEIGSFRLSKGIKNSCIIYREEMLLGKIKRESLWTSSKYSCDYKDLKVISNDNYSVYELVENYKTVGYIKGGKYIKVYSEIELTDEAYALEAIALFFLICNDWSGKSI